MKESAVYCCSCSVDWFVLGGSVTRFTTSSSCDQANHWLAWSLVCIESTSLAGSVRHFQIITAAWTMTDGTGLDHDITDDILCLIEYRATWYHHMRPRQQTVMAGGTNRGGG